MTRTKAPDAARPPLAAALYEARQRARRRSGSGTANQIDVARLCDVTQSTISGWESGKEKPRLDRLSTVARAYGINERRLRALWMQAEVGEAA